MSLGEVANSLVADGKGIFAADASPKTIGKRAGEMGMEMETIEQRRKYREVILTAAGLGKYVGGIILHVETLGQSTSSGISFVDVINKEGIMPGVKVDQGTMEMQPGSAEKVTQGLEGLADRLAEYARAGAKFTKWRAMITITATTPTSANIDSNAKSLAKYAKLSQQTGLVPVVEPEVLMEGDHTLDRCADVTRLVGKKVFQAMLEYEVDLAGMLYKPNMVLAGADCPAQPTGAEVAQKTVEVMQEVVPPKVPGIPFLSGGQDAILATQRLNEIAKLGAGAPWRLTFSFERGIEGPAMQVWAGKDENTQKAQRVLLHRAKCNSLASLGKYTEGVEHEI